MHSRRSRGVGLIEVILFAAIALGLITGGIVFFNQASEAARVNEAVKSIVSLQTGIRSMYQATSTFGVSGVDLLPATIASGAANKSLITPEGGLLNEWGGAVTVAGYASGFTLGYGDTPLSACVRLAPHTAQGNGSAGTGIAAVSINGVLVDADGNGSVSSDEAALACAMPTSPVAIRWAFAANPSMRLAAADFEEMLGIGEGPGGGEPDPDPEPEPVVETGRIVETATQDCPVGTVGQMSRSREVVTYSDGSAVELEWSGWDETACSTPTRSFAFKRYTACAAPLFGVVHHPVVQMVHEGSVIEQSTGPASMTNCYPVAPGGAGNILYETTTCLSGKLGFRYRLQTLIVQADGTRKSAGIQAAYNEVCG